MTTQTKYGMTASLDCSYEEAIEKVTAALKDQGFGILTEIDVKATMKNKLDVDTEKYIILGACNPKLAYRALQSEKQIGLLLPCNVIVYEDGARSHVAILDPSSMLSMTGNEGLCDVTDEAKELLEKALASLS